MYWKPVVKDPDNFPCKALLIYINAVKSLRFTINLEEVI